MAKKESEGEKKDFVNMTHESNEENAAPKETQDKLNFKEEDKKEPSHSNESGLNNKS